MLDRFLEDRDLFEEKVALSVFDNASEENLEGVVLRFSAQGLRIRYHRNPQNIGPDLNICACFRAGEGRYTWVLGSDDIPLRGVVRRLVSLLETASFGLVHLNHYGESSEPLVTYTDASAFFADMYVWISFISANIVRTSFIAEVDLESFADSSLSQVPLYLVAGFSSPVNAVLYGPYLEPANDALMNGGYNIFQVFADNLLAMVGKEMTAGTLPASAYCRFKHGLYRKFLAENILNFLILNRATHFDTAAGWKTIRKHYGKEPYLIPDLLAVAWKFAIRRLRRRTGSAKPS